MEYNNKTKTGTRCDPILFACRSKHILSFCSIGNIWRVRKRIFIHISILGNCMSALTYWNICSKSKLETQILQSTNLLKVFF